MNNRLWGVVALFGGVVLMLGLWVVLGADTETDDASGRAAAAAGEPATSPRKQFKGGKQATVDAENLARATSPADIVARQRMVAAMRARGTVGANAPAAPGGSVFTFDENGIRTAIGQRRADLDACWTAATATDASMTPSFTATIAVTPATGHTYAEVTAVTSDHGAVLDDCMTAVLMGTKFGIDQAASARYPMSFAE